ncbi:hypothetical protein ACF0H5_020739 [Mactra antiquata]
MFTEIKAEIVDMAEYEQDSKLSKDDNDDQAIIYNKNNDDDDTRDYDMVAENSDNDLEDKIERVPTSFSELNYFSSLKNRKSGTMATSETVYKVDTDTSDKSERVPTNFSELNYFSNLRNVSTGIPTTNSEMVYGVDMVDYEVDNNDNMESKEKKSTLAVSKPSVPKVTDRTRCEFCHQYFSCRKVLRKHCMRRHAGKWLEYECEECPMKFKTKEQLWQHRQDSGHGPRRVFNHTSKEYATVEEMRALGHIQCDICYNFYPHQVSLRRHKNKIHRTELPKWACPVCGTEFNTRDELWIHKRETKHNTSLWSLGVYQCDSCGKVFNRCDSFREHKLSCKTEAEKQQQIKQFPCDVCGLMFLSLKRMKYHKRGVHVNSPEICEDCGAVCKNKRYLLAHRRRHNAKNRKYICDDCGKRFFNSSLLRQHIRTHTKEKPFKCPMCNFTCAIKQNIHKHSLKVHKILAKAIDLTEQISGSEKVASEGLNLN